MSLPVAILILGVAGSGKSTIGSLLARDLGWPCTEADDFHPPANIAKMSAGIPLTDEDRAPWLRAIHDHLDRLLSGGQSVVVACSALKQRYRTALAPRYGRMQLVFLRGEFSLILERLRQRQGHFMKENLLRSQFEALEIPADALTVEIGPSPAAIVAQIRSALRV